MAVGDDGAQETTGRAARPPWPDGRHPPWCSRDHDTADHPEDGYHQSEPLLLPVVAGAADTVPVTASLRPLTLVVRAGRYEEERAWLVVEAEEEPRPRMALTLEAARALAAALLAQLDTLGEDP